MTSFPIRRMALAVALAAGASAAPASAAQSLASEALSLGGTTARTCHAKLLDGAAAGVTQRSARTAANGVVTARLSGPAGADHDVAIFDRASGALVAASAHAGSTELAEGFVGPNRDLVIQVCRVSGAAGAVQLEAQLAPSGKISTDKPRLVAVELPNVVAREALETLDLDLTDHERPGVQDAVLYDAADAAKLTKAGLSFTTVIEDLPAVTKAAVNLVPPAGTTGLPSGRTAYRVLADYSADMKKLATENPGLVKSITLPFPSLEGRPVEGIEITQDVEAKDGKPVFLQLGVHHAREWPSGEHAIEFAFDLVNQFKAGNARTKDLLSKSRVIVVPVVNVDGFNLSRQAPVDAGQPVVDPGFAYKRKNCRVTDEELPAAGTCGLQSNRSRGVDPNRNYGGLWGGGGATGSPTGETYYGIAPFSEPETQNTRSIFSSRQVTTAITNHTYSDLILRPPGIASQGLTPDEGIYKALGDSMAAENGYTSQKSWELYDTTGTMEDWSYFATGGLGFTFEIGRALPPGPTGLGTLVGVGFHPAHPLGVTAEYYGKTAGGGNREAYFKALAATANPVLHSVAKGTGPAGATVRFAKTFMTEATKADEETGEPITFQDTLDTVLTIPASGAFEAHVNPSTRPVTVKKGEPAESWTVTCETGGVVRSTHTLFIGRNEVSDLGALCKG